MESCEKSHFSPSLWAVRRCHWLHSLMWCYWNSLKGGVTGNVQPVTLPCIWLEQRWELQEDEWMVHVVLFRFICRSKTLSSYALIPTLVDANASIREPRYNGTGHRCLLWSVTFSARRGLFCSWCKAANAGAMLQGFVSDASRLKLRKDVWWFFFFCSFSTSGCCEEKKQWRNWHCHMCTDRGPSVHVFTQSKL